MRCMLVLLMLLPMTAFSADGLGRLFTTPAERANLDHLRQTTNLQAIAPVLPEGEDAAPAMPPAISVQGYVKRSDGKKGTVWVNHSPIQENSGTEDVQVGKLPREGNQVQLKLPAMGKSLNLKAGQVYVPEADSVSETSARIKKVFPEKSGEHEIPTADPAPLDKK